MTLPSPEIPLLYPLHYAPQGCQELGDGVPPNLWGVRRNTKKGRATSKLRTIFLKDERA